MRVPLLDLTEQYFSLANSLREKIDKVLASGRFILGPNVEAFEQGICRHTGALFRYLSYKEGDLPETEGAARETLALPINPEIRRETQRYVVNAIREFSGKIDNS